jgi:hypothetical protein
MKTVHVCKADDTDPVTIVISDALPAVDSLEEAGEAWEREAERLFAAVRNSISQGVYDRLFALICRDRANQSFLRLKAD